MSRTGEWSGSGNNGKFSNSSEELAQESTDGEVDMVVLNIHCPRTQSRLRSYPPTNPIEIYFIMPQARLTPNSAQPYFPHYSLEASSVLHGRWSVSFLLRSSSGLQILYVSLAFNVPPTRSVCKRSWLL